MNIVAVLQLNKSKYSGSSNYTESSAKVRLGDFRWHRRNDGCGNEFVTCTLGLSLLSCLMLTSGSHGED